MMSNFDKIILAEKQRHYQVDEKDQFVFETLTKVQQQKPNSFSRLLTFALVVIISIALTVQLLFLKSASFETLATLVSSVLTTKPYY
ncbi:MAG: hypothetical protein MK188_05250, partial [Gammaproteobacteria bacterium]|nr:hypothetical protein [Gammaproteobacteria bacterium]